MTTDPIRVLIVDDRIYDREYLAEQLRQEHRFAVDTASDSDEGIARVSEAQGNYDVILMDIRLGGDHDGIEIMQGIRNDYPHIETIIVTGFAGVEDGVRAMKAGAYTYVVKPLRQEEIVVHIRSAAERRRLRADLDQTAKEREWLQSLLAVSQALTSTLDPEQVAREIYQQAHRVIPQMNVFYIATYDEVIDELRFLLMAEQGEITQQTTRSLCDEENWGLTGYIVKTREPQFINDLQAVNYQLPVRCLISGNPARSYIGFPLISRGKVIGVLSVQSYEPDAFNEDHRRLVEAIANQSAVAIENALLHQQTAHRVLILSKLYETLTALRTNLDPDLILDLIVGNLQDLFLLDTCTIGFFDPNMTKLDFVAVRGLPGKVSRLLKELPSALVAQVFASNEPIEIANVDEHTDLKKALVRPDLRSFIILPLWGRQKEPLGIITMGSTGCITMPAEQKYLLRALADQAAIAIENARLYQQMVKWAQQLEVLDQLAIKIASPLKMKDLLRKIIRSATELLRGHGGGIYLSTESEDHLVLEASHNLPAEMEGRSIGKDRGVVGHVLKTRQPFIKTNYREWKERLRLLDKLNLKAVIGAPVISPRGQLFGVIAVHVTEEGREFNRLDEQALLRFGRHAGAAIQNAKLSLLLEERDATDEVARALVSVLDYKDLLNKILQVLQDRFGYTYCAVLLKNDSTNELYIETGEKGIVGLVAATGKPQTVPDVSKEPRYISGVPNGRSEIAVPLQVRGKTIGVLNVESTEPNAFDKRDERILTSAAAAIAIAIANARLFQEVKQKRDRYGLLVNFTKSVSEAQDLDKALLIVAESLMKGCPSTLCCVLIRTRDGEAFRVRFACPSLRSAPLNWNTSEGQVCDLFTNRRVARLFENKDCEIIKRGESYNDRLLDAITQHLTLEVPLDSVLLIPLMAGTEVLGLCVLGEMRQWERGSFTGDGLNFALSLAAQAAAPIEKARKLELKQHHADVLEQLNEVGNVIASTLDLDQVLDLIAMRSQEMLNAEVCSIFLVRRKGFLTWEANRGSPPGSFRKGETIEIKQEANARFIGYLAALGEVFNKHGEGLLQHPAVRHEVSLAHLPSKTRASVLAIPLKHRIDESEELIGMIVAENKKDRIGTVDPSRGFDYEDNLILSGLADYTETAIRTIQLFAQAQMSHKVAEAVYSALDMDVALQNILAQLRIWLQFDTASIQLRVKENLRVVACEGFDEEAKRKVLQLVFPMADPKFPNYEVIKRKAPYSIPDVHDSEYRHLQEEADTYCTGHVRSWLGIPLLYGDEIIGMISIESSIPGRYKKDDEDLAIVFAKSVVTPIAHAKLYKSSQRMLDFVEGITKQLDLQSVLRRIAEEAVDDEGLIGADIAIIYLYNPDKGIVDQKPVYAGAALRFPDKINPPFSPESVIYHLLNSRQLRIKDDVSGDELIDRGFVKREGIKSVAAIPLLFGEQPVGVMFVNFRTHHSFTLAERNRIKRYARDASTAIEIARRFEAVNERLEATRNAAVALSALSAWAHDTAANTFILRSDAKSLPNYISNPSPKALKILERITSVAEKVATLIPYTPPDLTQRRSIKLEEAFQRALQQNQEGLRGRTICLDSQLAELPYVMANEWLLTEAFNHLIQNALKAMGRSGTLSLSGQVKASRVYVKVSDTGKGIPPEKQEELFRRQASGSDRGGLGIGLMLTWLYLNACDGDILLDHSDSHGTVFVFHLPVAV